MLEILLALARSKASRPLSIDGGETPPPDGDCTPATSTVRRMTTGSVSVIVREFFKEVDWVNMVAPCKSNWDGLPIYEV
jgi:hypothetical protein